MGMATALQQPTYGTLVGGSRPIARGTGVSGTGRLQAVAATRRKLANDQQQQQRHEMRERMRYIMFETDERWGERAA
jgi:hypothetical protein